MNYESGFPILNSNQNFLLPSMATPPELTYEMNERVLCYHGPLIYEAKVLKPPVVHTEETAPPAGPGPYYFVHYKGWKQTYVWRHQLHPFAHRSSCADGTNGFQCRGFSSTTSRILQHKKRFKPPPTHTGRVDLAEDP